MDIQHQIRILEDRIRKLEDRVTQLELYKQSQTPPPKEDPPDFIRIPR